MAELSVRRKSPSSSTGTMRFGLMSENGGRMWKGGDPGKAVSGVEKPRAVSAPKLAAEPGSFRRCLHDRVLPFAFPARPAPSSAWQRARAPDSAGLARRARLRQPREKRRAALRSGPSIVAPRKLAGALEFLPSERSLCAKFLRGGNNPGLVDHAGRKTMRHWITSFRLVDDADMLR
jgi:hypothetical protein